MQDFVMDRMEARPPMAVPTPRTLHQRLQAADAAWDEFMQAKHDARERRTPLSAALMTVLFSRFVHECFDDPALRERALQDFDRHLSAELPRPQGRLL